MIKHNEFRVIGTVISVFFEYRPKKGAKNGETVPICEVEIAPHGSDERMKIVYFYEKAEAAGADLVENDVILCKGRIRGTKNSHLGKTMFNTELWGSDYQKDKDLQEAA